MAGRLRVAAAHLLDETPDLDHLDPAGQAGALLDVLVRSVQGRPRPGPALAAADRPLRGLPDEGRGRPRPTADRAERPATAASTRARHRVSPSPTRAATCEADLEVVERRRSRRRGPLGEVRPAHRYPTSRPKSPAVWTATARSLVRSPGTGPLGRCDASRPSRDRSGVVRGLSRAGPCRCGDLRSARHRPRPDRLAGPLEERRRHRVEVPSDRASERLAAIGACLGKRLVAVVTRHDPHRVRRHGPPRGVGQVRPVPRRREVRLPVAAVSPSTAAEFSGLRHRTADTGAATARWSRRSRWARRRCPRRPPASARRSVPNILVVGSHEPRKNHLAVLHAAEVLWREGVVFSLTFIGGSGWGEEFPSGSRAPASLGRPMCRSPRRVRRRPRGGLPSAAFTVFPSLHEGFGLPVAESIAPGVPRSSRPNFGATAETAGAGGAALVDPRDDGVSPRRCASLLTDRVASCATFEKRLAIALSETGSEYADDLWAWLVEPERRSWTLPADGGSGLPRRPVAETSTATVAQQLLDGAGVAVRECVRDRLSEVVGVVAPAGSRLGMSRDWWLSSRRRWVVDRGAGVVAVGRALGAASGGR